MTPDAATVIAYSAGLFALIFLFFLCSSRGEAGHARRGWYGLPFLLGSMAAILLLRPTVLPGIWGLRLAVFCILLAYGAAWQVARVANDREPLMPASFAPCAVYLGLSSVFVHDLHGWREVVSAVVRLLLVAVFNGLASWEFWREREKRLPSATLLCRVFAVYAGLHLVRAVGAPWLPAPLGIAATELWAVALYNLAVVSQALLVSAFIIALLREKVAAEHQRLAFHDVMTGAGNRRAFEAKIQEYVGSREARGLALILLDIDRFKSINDRYGHAYGDLVIIRAAEVARKVLQRSDLVFRIGGEEFACLVEKATKEQAAVIAEQLRTVFEWEARRIRTVVVSATISVGVAWGHSSIDDMSELLAHADAALYTAKRAGRNKVSVAGNSPLGAFGA